MTAHAHHHSRPKRWDESWHVAIGTAITVALVFALVFGLAKIPMKPDDPSAPRPPPLDSHFAGTLSHQEARR